VINPDVGAHADVCEAEPDGMRKGNKKSELENGNNEEKKLR
jgi:hypothetical protein